MSTTVSEVKTTQAPPAPATPQNRRAEPEPGTRWRGVTRPYSEEDVQARGYKERGMPAYADLQEAEFAAEACGYTAIRHQREVGTGYFDEVSMVISGGESSTTALHGSTEAEQSDQFED